MERILSVSVARSCTSTIVASPSSQFSISVSLYGFPERTRGRVKVRGTVRTCDSSSGDVLNLGRTSLRVSKLGIGTLQWGDTKSGYGTSYGEEDLASAFDVLIKGGINFFDTAEVYGYQGIKSGESSEQLLGKFASRPSVLDGGESLCPVIASKFFPVPWTNFLVGGGFRLGRSSLLAALRESLKRVGKSQIDLYQEQRQIALAHHTSFIALFCVTVVFTNGNFLDLKVAVPGSEVWLNTAGSENSALLESLKEAVELGLTKTVGVSNFSMAQMEEADDLLAKFGIPLASNQVQFSLLHQNPLQDGVLKACQERSITLIAYSPLASGQLSTKTLLKDDNQSVKIKALLQLMQSIGACHGGKSVSQVALNYLISKGALPIVGVKSVQQAQQHIEVLGWKLADNEVAGLEERGQSLR